MSRLHLWELFLATATLDRSLPVEFKHQRLPDPNSNANTDIPTVTGELAYAKFEIRTFSVSPTILYTVHTVLLNPLQTQLMPKTFGVFVSVKFCFMCNLQLNIMFYRPLKSYSQDWRVSF